MKLSKTILPMMASANWIEFPDEGQASIEGRNGATEREFNCWYCVATDIPVAKGGWQSFGESCWSPVENVTTTTTETAFGCDIMYGYLVNSGHKVLARQPESQLTTDGCRILNYTQL